MDKAKVPPILTNRIVGFQTAHVGAVAYNNIRPESVKESLKVN